LYVPLKAEEAVPAKPTIGFSDDTPGYPGHTIPVNWAMERLGHAQTPSMDFREE
jgi:hypothetical protein